MVRFFEIHGYISTILVLYTAPIYYWDPQEISFVALPS